MKYSELLIIIGVTTPALLSLFFIFQFGVNTLYFDDWNYLTPFESYLTGKPWIENLFTLYDQHHPVFPRLVILGLAYFTSYNTFYEMLVGWTFLSLTLFVLWRLLLQTFPEGKWIIILIAWLTYSFSQYEALLWGSTSIVLYLPILMSVSTIYFLNKIKDSTIWIIPAIICGFIASFSFIIGLLIWIIGLISFRDISKKLLTLYAFSGITSFVLYFDGWKDSTSGILHILADNPVGFLNFVLAYLGNATRIRGAEGIGINTIHFSSSVGIIAIGIFVFTILVYYCFHVGKYDNQKIWPWLQIAIFGLLCGIITAIYRLGREGIDMALSSRYVSQSNLFLDGTLVITLMVLFHMKRITTVPRNRSILTGSIVVLLILVISDIGLSNTVGWFGATMFHEKLTTATSCMLNIESASDDCLLKLYQYPESIREKVRILQEFCLGPFVSQCK